MPQQNGDVARQRVDEDQVLDLLKSLSTATISMALLKNGLRNVWIRKSFPVVEHGERVAGRAFTMRFVPWREDVATTDSLSSPYSTRGAIEAMPKGCVAVVDAMGINNVGIFGDILCARMKQRGVAALVTDGAVRDLVGVRKTGLPTWCNGRAAPPSVAGLTFVGWDQPIGCGGVAVFSGDMVVADEDGAVVIPDALIDAVIEAAPNAETMESWVLEQVESGRPLTGLYPPDARTSEEYAAWLSSQDLPRKT